MTSRACIIAGRLRHTDLPSRRAVTLAHACCEGYLDSRPCDCACHRAAIELVSLRGDPLPLIHGQPGGTPLEEAAA